MIKKAHTKLYVDDQQKSTDFYKKLFDMDPILKVPGMTEFQLSETAILGLMPSKGIKNLLGDKIVAPQKVNNKPRAELYLVVENISEYIIRAEKLDTKLLDGLKLRDWGHNVIYFEDLDGYIIAIAESMD